MKFILFLFLSIGLLYADIDILLEELAHKDDLSQQTKKESAGYLTIYTRADLDQMKIRNIQELIAQIPFIRYNETNRGFSDPLYHPYQPASSIGLNVYIDDRELLSPFGGNGLLIFGQVSLDYIDHIEVYMGIPSQSFGLQPSLATIKCYSKDPKREQANVIGVNYGTHGSNKEYGYTAQTHEGYEYLLTVSHENNNAKKVTHNESSLSKNNAIYKLQAKIQKENIKLDLQIAHLKLDTFMGTSYNIDPINPNANISHMHIGFSYDRKKDGLKVSASYTQNDAESYDDSMSILGLTKIPTSPFVIPYTKSYIHLEDQLYNAKLLKTFKTEKNTLLFGVHGRIKHFDMKELKHGNQIIPKAFDYDTEKILSLSVEDSYLIDASTMITMSVLHNQYYENSDVKNYDTTSGRIGYIYNNNTFISKSFIFIGESIPEMQVLYENRALGQTTDLKKSNNMAVSTKMTYKSKDFETSLLYGHTVTQDNLYFDGTQYFNAESKYILDTFSYRLSYDYNVLNRVIFNAWTNFTNNKNLSKNQKSTSYGAYITIFNSFKKFDFYNNLIYKNWNDTLADGYNFNSTITYNYSRKLNLYLKANNIFEKALKSNYYSINPITEVRSELNGVDVIDRTLIIGLEYQF